MLGLHDLEALKHSPETTVTNACTEKESSAANDVIQATVPMIKLSLREINPFKLLLLVLRRWNNVVILFASGK